MQDFILFNFVVNQLEYEKVNEHFGILKIKIYPWSSWRRKNSFFRLNLAEVGLPGIQNSGNLICRILLYLIFLETKQSEKIE